MRYFSILLLAILFSFTSCRKDFDTVPSSGKLEFSKTEVYLDTVFSTIGSSTYGLKVYNRSNNDIKIPIIQLEKGFSSKYRIIVDGIAGNNKIFNNVELLANDSLYVFVATTVNIADTENDFTYNDKILFDVGTNQQSVKLTTLVDDANFIFPNRSLDKKTYEKIAVNGFSPDTRGHTLTATELNWTSAKPYVIYGNCVVPSGSTLNIGAGTRVHFHDGSTLIVDSGATLNIQGNLNVLDANGKIITRNEVTFEGDRLEPEYENVPGQWGAVFIFSNTNNIINHLTLKNAVVGLFMGRNIETITPNLTIENSQIYDCSSFGILARASIINGKNIVVNTAGQSCFAGTLGGNYDFTHCTFNNNWPSTKQVAVLLNDFLETKEETFVSTIYAKFKNCIIYGNNNVELFLEKRNTSTTSSFVTSFTNCLVKFNDFNTSISGQAIFNEIRNQQNGNLKNLDPKFNNINRNFMNLQIGSSAIGKGNFIFSNFNDILNLPRTNPSDIGAYKFIP